MTTNKVMNNIVENTLKNNLPNDYKIFIDNIGYISLDNIGIEIYGHKPEFSMTKLPSVVAATELYRKDYKLKDSLIVISHSGFEDYLIVLDTITGVVFELNIKGDVKIIADSFSKWLQKIILENELAGRAE